MQCVAMDVITIKLINLLLNLQLFNAFPSSERIHVVPLKILHSIKITIFAHPVQKSARDYCPTYGSNVLPNGYSRPTSECTFVRHAGSPQLEFCEK